MALTYLGTATALQRGVELAETGVSINTFTVRYFPEVNERLQNNLGETAGRVISTLSSREVSLEAEVTGTTGVMTFTFIAACTVANDIADFGSPTGGLYLHEVTVTQSRADWRKLNMRLESNPGLA